MAAPEVTIEVNQETGAWVTDGVEMIYTPRAFFVNIQKQVEQAIGVEAYAKLLHRAAYDATYPWCGVQAKLHGLSGMDVFHHYLKRLSQRGWGKFSLIEADPAAGTALIRLDHSAIAAGYGGTAARPVCTMFPGAFDATMDWVRESLGHDARAVTRELRCAAQDGRDHCVFAIESGWGLPAGGITVSAT